MLNIYITVFVILHVYTWCSQAHLIKKFNKCKFWWLSLCLNSYVTPIFFGFPYVLILMSNPNFPLKLSNWNFPQEIFKSVFLLLWSKVEIDIGIQWLDKGIMTQWSNQKGKEFERLIWRVLPILFREHIEIGIAF